MVYDRVFPKEVSSQKDDRTVVPLYSIRTLTPSSSGRSGGNMHGGLHIISVKACGNIASHVCLAMLHSLPRRHQEHCGLTCLT